MADPSGAPVPQARVIVTNTATNVTTAASTNSAGYAVPYLSSGTYQIAVTAGGFDAVVRQGITLHVDDKVSQANFPVQHPGGLWLNF